MKQNSYGNKIGIQKRKLSQVSEEGNVSINSASCKIISA